MRLMCPHCKDMAYTRTSEQLTTTSRWTIFVCRNPECGCTFKAVTEINCMLSPSATPDPSVVIPLSSHVQRGLLSQLLQTMPTRQHTRLSPPVTGDLFDALPATG